MDYISKTINSDELAGIFEIPSLLRNRKVQVIILPAADGTAMEKETYKCNIGFAKGADLPDSFFEPLPDEDLHAWGL